MGIIPVEAYLVYKINEESEYNPMKLYKSETVMLEKEMEIYNTNQKTENAEGRNSINSP